MATPRKLPGGIRLRSGSYYADFRAGGRRVRKRLSSNLEAAKQILNELKARADKADFDLLDNDFPLAELKEKYLRHCRQISRPNTVIRYAHSLDCIVPRLGATRAGQITVENLDIFREERLAEGVSPATVNKDVDALSRMLRWGCKHGFIAKNPLEGARRLRHDEPREGRALSTEEVNRLLDKSPQPWRDIWYAFLVSGLRKGELAGLLFSDIDWQRCEIVIRASGSKNHQERRIPIDAGLWRILQQQLAGRGQRQPGRGKTAAITKRVQLRFSRDHVFVTTENTPLTHSSGLYHALHRCCKLAGIPVVTLGDDGREIDHLDVHSFRRTFVTSAIEGGADPKSVQALLGHKTLAMTMNIYAKSHPQTRRQALGRLAYGEGAVVPDGVLDYPESRQFPARNGHQLVTGRKRAAEQSTQVLMAQ